MPKRSRLVFETDELRLQHKVNAFSTWHVPILSELSGKKLKLYMTFCKIKLPSCFLEAGEIRDAISSHLKEEACPICLETQEEGDKMTLLPCGHAFHTKCIHTAAQESLEIAKANKRNVWPRPSCPVCRKEF